MEFVAGWTYWLCWLSLAMADLTATGNLFEILVQRPTSMGRATCNSYLINAC
jgi:L-asparagine transporter-like permease